MLGFTTSCTKVVTFVRRDMVGGVTLVLATAVALIVEVGGCRVGGVYGTCGVGVHTMKDWLDSLVM